jgi:hypothetical protein
VTRTIVVTCPVPCTSIDELTLTPVDHTLDVAGPGGFSHELELPGEADMDRLDVELYKGILEVRAPLSSP